LENAAGGGEGELSARLRALKSEMMSVAKLSGRVRELEQVLIHLHAVQYAHINSAYEYDVMIY
jgi:hypothetical protein